MKMTTVRDDLEDLLPHSSPLHGVDLRRCRSFPQVWCGFVHPRFFYGHDPCTPMRSLCEIAISLSAHDLPCLALLESRSLHTQPNFVLFCLWPKPPRSRVARPVPFECDRSLYAMHLMMQVKSPQILQ